jgi:predicted nucleic acid-binding protein
VPWFGADAAGLAIRSRGSGQEHRFDIGPRLRAAGLILYFDTSALIKLIVVEDGSDLAAELWASGHPAASSMLSYPEGRAALAAARRQGRLGEVEHGQALAVFEELQEDLVMVGVDADLAHSAGEHAEALGLRGYDAVHLTTALELGDEEVVLVTWDRDLARAAEMVGLGLAGTTA